MQCLQLNCTTKIKWLHPTVHGQPTSRKAQKPFNKDRKLQIEHHIIVLSTLWNVLNGLILVSELCI